jgi:hypothetical protein
MYRLLQTLNHLTSHEKVDWQIEQFSFCIPFSSGPAKCPLLGIAASKAHEGNGCLFEPGGVDSNDSWQVGDLCV